MLSFYYYFFNIHYLLTFYPIYSAYISLSLSYLIISTLIDWSINKITITSLTITLAKYPHLISSRHQNSSDFSQTIMFLILSIKDAIFQSSTTTYNPNYCPIYNSVHNYAQCLSMPHSRALSSCYENLLILISQWKYGCFVYALLLIGLLRFVLLTLVDWLVEEDYGIMCLLTFFLWDYKFELNIFWLIYWFDDEKIN